MNGNIVKVDNLKDSKGKRRGFIMTQNEILERLYIKERDANAYALYCFLWQRGNSDFNLTVDTLSSVTGSSKRVIIKSLKKLEEVGLLAAKAEKELPGMPKVITTQDGRQVPNTRRKYVIYSALPGSGEAAQLLTPGTVITPAEFTADEIQESESAQEQSGEVIGEMPQESQAKPPQLVQTPPVLKPPQTPVQRDSRTAEAMEQRKEKVCRIADGQGLFGQKGKERLLYWLQKFAKEVGRPADDEEIAFIANLLSGDCNYNLNGYIKRKALAEKLE